MVKKIDKKKKEPVAKKVTKKTAKGKTKKKAPSVKSKKPSEKELLQLKCKELGIKFQPNDAISMLEGAIRGKQAEDKLAKAQELGGAAKVTVIEPESDEVIQAAKDKIEAEKGEEAEKAEEDDGIKEEPSTEGALETLQAARMQIREWGLRPINGQPSGDNLQMTITNNFPNIRVEAERPRNTMEQIAFKLFLGGEMLRCPSENPADFFSCSG